MGFKLGTERGLEATGGEIRTKMRFHKEDGDPNLSVPGTPVIRKKLEPGILGEANMDGTIYVSDQLDPDSFEMRQTIIHEMKHATNIKIGKEGYTDDYVMYNGDKFPRETKDGKDMILVEGEWKEVGDEDLPWEIKADNGVVI